MNTSSCSHLSVMYRHRRQEKLTTDPTLGKTSWSSRSIWRQESSTERSVAARRHPRSWYSPSRPELVSCSTSTSWREDHAREEDTADARAATSARSEVRMAVAGEGGSTSSPMARSAVSSITMAFSMRSLGQEQRPLVGRDCDDHGAGLFLAGEAATRGEEDQGGCGRQGVGGDCRVAWRGGWGGCGW